MSLRTRINCYTGWVNWRLLEREGGDAAVLGNVLTDLLTGSHLKHLVHSMVGYPPSRLGNLDDVTQNQVITRVEWAVKELKQNSVIAPGTEIDGRMFAMRSADQVFTLLQRLVNHDIHFLWDRQEFLRLGDGRKLCEVPLKWVPDRIYERKGKRSGPEMDEEEAMLMGFGNTAAATQTVEYEPIPPDFERYSGTNTCLQYKSAARRGKKRPSPEKCMLEMIQNQLNTTEEGRALDFTSLRELGESSVLCALINTFVNDTFSSEILLKDRWAFNLAIRTFEKMVHLQTQVSCEDFADFDTASVCAYMCTFFMLMYKYRQTAAVVKRYSDVKMNIRRAELELNKLAEERLDSADASLGKAQHKHWEASVASNTEELQRIERLYDISWCENWVKHASAVQTHTRLTIRAKMADRFDTVLVPRNMTVAELVSAQSINLSLTKGNGFAKIDSSKEMVQQDKRIVLRSVKTGEYLEDFTGNSKEGFNTKKLLGYPPGMSFELRPEKHPKYEIFIEISTMQKTLRAGTEYLYQVFPGGTSIYEAMLQKAVKAGEYEVVRKFVIFFDSEAYVNCCDPNTGNSPLHWACKAGFTQIALFLLEHGARMNALNHTKCTPFFYAMTCIHKDCAQLLIEWGADTWYKDHTGKCAWDCVRNAGLKDTLFRFYEYLAEKIPLIVKGDTEALSEVIKNHIEGVHPFTSLRSRSIQGSTLLHTACHFGHTESVETLLSEGVDVNLRDYKGATPLHRVKTVECMGVLIEAGADVTLQDHEGNTPMHLVCFEGTGGSDSGTCMNMLIKRGGSVLSRNCKNLLPIHCAAMRGDTETLMTVLSKDEAGTVESLQAEPETDPPSLLFLAMNEFHVDCANDLLSLDIKFKPGEAKALLYKNLTGKSQSDRLVGAVTFLLDNGASATERYEPGQVTPLHLIASNVILSDLIELLLGYGEAADIDITDSSGSSPLFYACENNNPFGASLLLEHGANMRHTNHRGFMPLDLIRDFDDWIESGYFSRETIARLKAYSLKQSRDLVRAITNKVKGNSQWSQTTLQRMLLSHN